MQKIQRLGMKSAGLRLLLVVTLLISALTLLTGCGDDGAAAYISEVETWHSERLDSLRSDTGWLTLVGLHPLGYGENEIGSGAENDVVMAAAAPVRLGTVIISGDEAQFEVAEGVLINIQRAGEDGAQAFQGGEITTDAKGESDKLMTGSLVFYVIQRGEKFFLRVKDRQSATYTEFTGIDRFAVDPAWRIEAQLEGEAGSIRVANVLGQVSSQPSPGTLVFTLKGETYRLQPTGEADESLFLVFGDATNGSETYPGGRFLVTGVPDKGGKVIVDFNLAYNPPCVFTEYATCPLPSLSNRLDIAVSAGEKNWGTGH